MKRHVEEWTLEEVHKQRARLTFPEYQRQPNLWPQEKKALLIDSIMSEIDIPKLYFNHTKDKNYEVVDGQQRLWAIWDFLDDKYACKVDGKTQSFSALDKATKDKIKHYKLQITVMEDADDEYLRTLFLRLQLGLLLITGEKLHAASGAMKDFIFKTMVAHPFIEGIGIPAKRYAKQTLCAQICVNVFTRSKLNSFARTRCEDLLYFFSEYEHPQGKDLSFFDASCGKISRTLGELWKTFGAKSKDLRNRSYILSLYLLMEEAIAENKMDGHNPKQFADFAFSLWKRLKEEVGQGFDRKNRELYAFETLLSSAPGEKYQIERRHEKLREYYEYFLQHKKIKGDK